MAYKIAFDVDMDLVPAMAVVVSISDEVDAVRAAVLYQAKHAVSCDKKSRGKMAILFCTRDNDTAEEALEKLLLEDSWDSAVTEDVGGAHVLRDEGSAFVG